MAQIRPLNNPPITEAVLELRIRTELDDPTHDFWRAITQSMNAAYPKVDHMYETRLDFKEGEVKSRASSLTGVRLESADKTGIVQFWRDRFICSRLKPYAGWEQLIAAARPAWETFRAKMEPTAISRVAARFINSVEVPLGTGIEQVLLSPPASPHGVNAAVEGFNSRLMLNATEFGLRAISTVSVQPSTRDGYYTLLIDNDVFQTVDALPTDEEIFSILDRIRACKNHLFFGPLHEHALAMFD